MEGFSEATRAWFGASFEGPTRVQREGWAHIQAGEHALLCAPTGSGKTLAAFLWSIDRLVCRPADASPGVRVLYISPLKALAHDVERNLRAPLIGVERAAARVGQPITPVRVSLRTGDTPQRDRRRFLKEPGEILITTPESLYLMLGSKAAEPLRSVEAVIIDEIHALAPNKRGAHLSLSLERLADLCDADPQRIGLSATQKPLEVVAGFLGGDRPVRVVDAGEPPRVDLQIVVSVRDMENPSADRPPPEPPGVPAGEPIGGEEDDAGVPLLGGEGDAGQPLTHLFEEDASRKGIWPTIYPRLLALIRAHRSTILFVNSRLLCERLCRKLNELAGEELVRAHHGSVSRLQRKEVEEMLKSGQLRGLVATSSLELGIDMGAVDLVMLVESPGSVARGLQRVGRAGHGVGEVSRGRIFPKYRGDLLECAVVAREMARGGVEPIRVPTNCLDVLSQQVVAACAEPRGVDALLALVRRARGYRELSREALEAVLDMLSGRYPSDEMAEIKPRLLWDRQADTLTSRRDAKTAALLNAGTIPDRGMYGVYLAGEGPRIGELDEEMVYESRPGETFVLGATTWRIQEITRDRVSVVPAPGELGKLPFWRGEGPGRPVELGRALGAAVREIDALEADGAAEALAGQWHLDELAAGNLLRYLREQKEACGVLPTDETLVVECFRDELGDWRVCILSPFGARVHAPWALAIQALLGGRTGVQLQALYTDDGIALRFPDAEELPDLGLLLPDPDEVEELVLEELADSAMFASRFRENAARALLLPRKGPRKRTPLWAQRIRAQRLMASVRQYPSFPIVLETYRECLKDVFDLPALTALLRSVRRREVAVERVQTDSASPFARSLVFAYVASYLYEGDAPLAERKAQALTLDRAMLRELLGQEALRDLLDAAAIDEVEAELQRTAEGRGARGPDGLHDLLRALGDLSEIELEARCQGDPTAWIAALLAARRAARMRIAGEPRLVAVEDVAKYRDAFGAVPPGGLPEVFLAPAVAPLDALFLRYARTHGPFTTAALAGRYGMLPSQVEAVLAALEHRGLLLQGELTPGGVALEWCAPEVLRRLKRRSLARLRGQIAPVEAAALARFLPAWQGLERPRGGVAHLADVVRQLEGLALPFSALEEEALPARVSDFQPRMLDELGAMGGVVWVGRGALGSNDGRVALYRRESAHLLLDPPGPYEAPSPLHEAVMNHLLTRGASFTTELQSWCGRPKVDELMKALWDLVWDGRVTNDTFAPLRSLKARGRPTRRRGNPAVGGRWSAVAHLVAPATETERAHARARMLLDRYGVVSREAAASEGLPGGFSGVYPVLRAMEEAGRARRGYFVEGLSGAQFASPGAVDRLRGAREDGVDEVRVLPAVDPANPWGALLPWPEPADGGRAPQRAVGARVVLVGGAPVIYIQRGGKALRTFPETAEALPRGLAALGEVAARSRRGLLRVEKIDGVAAEESPLWGALLEAGFRRDYGGAVMERL
jgi:ATP-dependent Lhr-like helicase